MRVISVVLVGCLALGAWACENEKKSSDGAEAASAKPAATTKPASSASAQRPKAPPKPNDIPAPEDVATPPKEAETTQSGLASRVIEKGTGSEHPGETDKVKVHYTGWTKDGKMFDSSKTRGQPATFALNGVIKGWTEGVQLMVVGEKRRFWIPGKLAYGDQPRGGAPSGQLTFDIELLDIMKAPPPPEVPKDLTKPGPGTKKTASGLRYRVLEKGKGKDHPTAESAVRVHYSGWTLDGNMFDSSVVRGEPITFPLRNVIKGWTEGVQLMVEGEKTRFWIPSDLAYGKNPRPGAPKGELVFDIELIKILGGK